MQRFLNTLYVTTQKTYLHKKGEAVEVIIDDKVIASIPMINLDSIVCFGNIYVSPFLLGACPEYNITISFLSETGKYLARVQGPVAGNVLLRKQQYRISDDKEKSLEVAKFFIIGKIANQKTVLQRAVRDHGNKIDSEKVKKVIYKLNHNIDKIETVKDADEKEWIGVFTSSEEMHKGSAGNVQMNQSIESILRLALKWEQVNGIVINPFGKYIQMTKKMIELLINGYEHYENERMSKDDENN